MGVYCVLVPAAGFGDEGGIAEAVSLGEGVRAGTVFDALRSEGVGRR